MEQEEIPLHRFEDRFAHEEPFNIRQISVSAQQLDQWTTLPPHRHDFYEICLFVRARGVHHVDWSPYPIRDKTVFVLSPDTVHLMELQGEVQAYIICIGKDFLPPSLNDSFTSLLVSIEKHGPFTVADFSSLHSTAKLLLQEQEADSKAAWHGEMFKARVQILLIQLMRCQEFSREGNPALNGKHGLHTKIDEFRELLDMYYKEHYSVQQYAALLSLSVKQLNRLCKTISGKTASAFVQERLNAEAKRLLYNTILSIKEIAFALGFRESSHFSHFFFKRNKMFPNFFREAMLNKKGWAQIRI